MLLAWAAKIELMDQAKDGQSTSKGRLQPAQLSSSSALHAWERLRGICKDIFAELGGCETYLREERANFYSPERAREMGEPLPSPANERNA